MTYPWVTYNNFVKYYPDGTRHRGVMARTLILGMYALGQGQDTPLGHGQ